MSLAGATVIRANARDLPLADDSVDLIVTSPPYFALRSYQDGGEHYEGQIGSEPTPTEFVDALLDVTRECVRVLKPSGSLWVNLGDKYVADNRGSGGDKKRGQAKHAPAGPAGFVGRETARQKSLMGIPWRYAIRCIDELGLILRAEVIWSKPNGLPESVTDRVRRSHEQWFHFTREPRYFSAIDEIREPHLAASLTRIAAGFNPTKRDEVEAEHNGTMRARGAGESTEGYTPNPLGKLPGSVWTVPTEPLRVPDHLGIDHFAAFPTEWPKRIVQGWSPAGICTACGEGRRPVVASVSLDLSRPQARRAQELAERAGLTEEHFEALLSVGVSDTGRGAATQSGTGNNTAEVYTLANEAREVLGGYAREYLLRRPTRFDLVCACTPTRKGEGGRTVYELGDWNPPPTTPAVVLDPFGGTGTTAMVAKALGRHGVSVDMSADYCRLAEWRTNDPAQLAKVVGDPKPPKVAADQLDVFAALDGGAA